MSLHEQLPQAQLHIRPHTDKPDEVSTACGASSGYAAATDAAAAAALQGYEGTTVQHIEADAIISGRKVHAANGICVLTQGLHPACSSHDE